MKKTICSLGIIMLLTSFCFAQELPFVQAKPEHTYLSDLPLEKQSTFSVNKDFDGETIQLDSILYEKGICMEAGTELKIKLENNYKELNAKIGIGDKHFDYKSKLVFEISADGTVIYTSIPLCAGAVDEVKLPIENKKELTLKVTSADNEYTDFSVWADICVF